MRGKSDYLRPTPFDGAGYTEDLSGVEVGDSVVAFKPEDRLWYAASVKVRALFCLYT